MDCVTAAYSDMSSKVSILSAERDKAVSDSMSHEAATRRLAEQLQTREDELLQNFVTLLNFKKEEIRKLKEDSGGAGRLAGSKSKLSRAASEVSSGVVGREDDVGDNPSKKKPRLTEEEKNAAYLSSTGARRDLEMMRAHTGTPKRSSGDDSDGADVKKEAGAVAKWEVDDVKKEKKMPSTSPTASLSGSRAASNSPKKLSKAFITLDAESSSDDEIL